MASAARAILDRVYLVYFLIHIPVLFCKLLDFRLLSHIEVSLLDSKILVPGERTTTHPPFNLAAQQLIIYSPHDDDMKA